METPPVDLRWTAEPRSGRTTRLAHPTRVDRYWVYTLAGDIFGLMLATCPAVALREEWLLPLAAVPPAIVHLAHGRGGAALLAMLIRVAGYAGTAALIGRARHTEDPFAPLGAALAAMTALSVTLPLGVIVDAFGLAEREVPHEGWSALPELEPRTPISEPAAPTPAPTPIRSNADEPSDRATSIR